MLPHILAHAYKAIVCSDHQQTVVGLGRQQTEYGGAQVPFVSCEVSEADYFRLHMSVIFLAGEYVALQIAIRFPPR